MQKIVLILVLIFTTDICHAAVALGATRVVFDSSKDQTSLLVSNNSDENAFLVQSWVENDSGEKTEQFFMSPPLFAIHGKKENKLRITNTHDKVLANDKETLFWLNVKAIPSVSEDSKEKNTLQIAIVNRIKMFYRPSNLKIKRDEAIKHISFKETPNSIIVSNKSPYFITFSEIDVGVEKYDSFMIKPYGSHEMKIKKHFSGSIKFKTINDFGAYNEGEYIIK
ncbi:fimbrial biogenesis chaperone [Photobacterium damselae]|uniref:fimbrial biogenesis chaperone n=1 Tax=Photobacterium damselae TaxID=38293 RepID=UPI004068A9CB